MKRRHSRKYHRNPTAGLMREAGKTLLATAGGAAVAVAGAIGASKLTTDPRKHAAIVGGGAVALGVALHVNDLAPRVGKAVMGGGVAIAGQELAAHYGLEARLRSLVGGTPAPQSCPTGQSLQGTPPTCQTTPGGYPLAGSLPAPAGYPMPGVKQAAYPLAGASVRRR